MIDRERFEQLAALAVAGEATDAERAELDAALREDPSLARELDELDVTAHILRSAVATPAAAPTHVLADLDQTRREALTSRLAAEAKSSGAETVVPFAPAAGDRAARKRWSVADWLAIAASIVVVAGMVYLIFGPQKPDNTIAVLAPRGETGLAQPTLIWDGEPGQRYDVWIIPAEGSHIDAPALFVAKNVQPPVAFTDLQPGPALQGQPDAPRTLTPNTSYRLLVCLANAGRLAGTAFPFHTASNASSQPAPADFATAKQLAATNRPADALTILLTLPPTDRLRPEVRDFEAQLRDRLLSIPNP
jgi:hypothetical protein